MKQKLLKLMCLLCVSVISMSAWGETAGFTLTGSAGSTATGTISGTASETWNYSATFTSGATASAQKKSWQVGSSSKNCTQLVLSTNGISGIITKIDVSCGAQTGKGKVNCTVGGADFGTQNQSAGSGNNPTSYGTTPSFSGSASGEIVITINNTGTYISVKSITVTYTASTAPSISATTPAKLAYDATGGSISYSVSNPVAGGVVTAESSESWLTIGAVSASDVTFTCTTNGATERSATVTLTYTYNTSETVTKEVTVTQARYVSAVASLPFAFDGKQADIEETNGLTHAGIDAKDYTSSPYLKFNDIGDNLELKLTERPGTLSFDIQGKPAEGDYAIGTFQIQTSADGVTYTIYRTITNISKDVQSIEYVGFDANVRYIKWIYSAKTSGNVALGNIKVSATYNRATSAGNYGTLCLPYDATVAGAKLYSIVGKEITGSEVTAILLDEVASMEAGKPYIFKATADDVVATFTGSMYAIAGKVNGLYGTYSAIAAGEWGTYVSGDLYLLTTSNVQAADKTASSLAANRAYIVLDDVNNIGSPVKGVRLGFDGTETPTGIKNLTPALSEGEGVIYNLQGQQLSAPQRGINIIGGKKVLVK